MPLKPSRRLPRAFQRKTSKATRHMAKAYARKRKKGIHDHLAHLSRQWRRVHKGVQISFSRLKLWCAVSAVLLLFATIAFLLFSSVFAVSSIRVSRQDQRVDIEETQALLTPFFGKHILLLSPHLLERALEEAYPEVAEARVSRVMPNELSVLLYMKDVVADVLVGGPEDTEAQLEGAHDEDFYRYITHDGIYLEYPFLLSKEEQINDQHLTLHIVDWTVKPAHRQKLLTEDMVKELFRAVQILRETFGHRIATVTYYARAREFHILTENLTLWLDLASPIPAQIDRYRQFLRDAGPTAAEEYVDLRPRDRVIYR